MVILKIKDCCERETRMKEEKEIRERLERMKNCNCESCQWFGMALEWVLDN